jgi:AAA domain
MLIMLVGPPFSGKTVSASTFPKPMIYFDFDGGAHGVRKVKGKDGKLVVPDYEQIDTITFTQSKIFNLEFKSASEADFKAGVAPSYTKGASDILAKYNKEISNLETCTDTKTLVIDSASTLFRLWDEAIMFANKIPAIRIGDYKTLQGILFGQWLPSLKYLAEKIPWIIVVNHDTMDKNEVTGAISEFPVGPSNAMGRTMAKAFDCVWRQKFENGEYIWRTASSGLFKGAGSRITLPETIKPATYQELSKYL